MVRARLEEIGLAMALLTRLPLPRLHDSAFARQATSAWAWPLAGLMVGALGALAGLGAVALGLPVSVAALIALAVQMITTGAMHEDGLADTVDGLWGGWTRDRRLEIMKDSHIGTYGVLALIVSAGLRWSVLAGLLTLGAGPVVAIAVLSRASMPALMAALPNARGDGLAHKVGAPPLWAVLGAVGLSLIITLVSIGLSAVPATIAVLAGASLLGWIAWRKIGGQTGDILGASQQITEILAGLTLLILAI